MWRQNRGPKGMHFKKNRPGNRLSFIFIFSLMANIAFCSSGRIQRARFERDADEEEIHSFENYTQPEENTSGKRNRVEGDSRTNGYKKSSNDDFDEMEGDARQSDDEEWPSNERDDKARANSTAGISSGDADTDQSVTEDKDDEDDEEDDEYVNKSPAAVAAATPTPTPTATTTTTTSRARTDSSAMKEEDSSGEVAVTAEDASITEAATSVSSHAPLSEEGVARATSVRPHSGDPSSTATATTKSAESASPRLSNAMALTVGAGILSLSLGALAPYA